jgi:hypothetical protein
MSDREKILKDIDVVRHHLAQKIMSCHDAGLERQADQYADWDQLMIECSQHIRSDAPSPLSQWIDRDVMIGDVRFKAGSITISDVVDHAARAAAEFYDDDEPLSADDQRKIDAAWEIHKAAAPVDWSDAGHAEPEARSAKAQIAYILGKIEGMTVNLRDGGAHPDDLERLSDCLSQASGLATEAGNLLVNLAVAPAPQSAAITVEPVACDGFICQRYPADGVICADDDCDIRSGVYAAPTTSPEPDEVRDLTREIAALKFAPPPEPVNYGQGFASLLDEINCIAHMSGTCAVQRDLLQRLHRFVRQTQIAALSRPAHGGWEDISTAPKDADNIDLWCRNISHGSTDQTRFTGMFVNGDGKWEDWHGYVLEPKWRPTHWKRPDAGPISRNDRGSEAQ